MNSFIPTQGTQPRLLSKPWCLVIVFQQSGTPSLILYLGDTLPDKDSTPELFRAPGGWKCESGRHKVYPSIRYIPRQAPSDYAHWHALGPLEGFLVLECWQPPWPSCLPHFLPDGARRQARATETSKTREDGWGGPGVWGWLLR